MIVAMSSRVQATRRRFGGLIALVGTLLLVTGCGGGGGVPATATPVANAAGGLNLAGISATATQLAKGGGAVSASPSVAPTAVPTVAPTVAPTAAPTVAVPTVAPTTAPTATRPAATVAIAAASPTRSAATSTPAGAATIRPATTPTAPIAVGASDSSWTDPQGRVRVNIPAGWKVGTQLDTFFLFDGPSGALFTIITNAQSGTPEQESASKRAGLSRNADTTYTFGPTKDARVGNEPGKSFDFTTAPKSQPSAAPKANSSTIVNHGNTQYEFLFTNVGTRTADIDAFLGSIAFLK